MYRKVRDYKTCNPGARARAPRMSIARVRRQPSAVHRSWAVVAPCANTVLHESRRYFRHMAKVHARAVDLLKYTLAM